MSDLNFSLVFVSVYDTFHPRLTALCLPLPFGLQLWVVSLPLLLESSPRLLFIVATTVCLWLGLIYFKLLCSNNVRRPEVRKTRKKVNGKLLNIVTELQIVVQKENKFWGFYSLLCVWMLPAFFVCTHAQVQAMSRCFTCSKKVFCACRHKLSLSHTHTHLCAPHSCLFARV